MRAFIILCLVAMACADQLGYDYQPVGHTNSGLSFAPGASTNVPSFGSQDLSAPIGGPVSSGSPSIAPQAELEKEFYTFSANDGDFNDPDATRQVANAVKQGLRVIFIKGPENHGLEDSVLALAKQAANQKTAIYVLNKQADLGNLVDRLNTENKNNNNKPEVHFVKYRTPEDAANAQKAIQSQYDQLGGPSKQIDGGVASALNFASRSPFRAGSASIPLNSYLPSSVF